MCFHTKTICAEGGSLAEARALLWAQTPEGQFLFSQETISDGQPVTQVVTAETVEAALCRARAETPKGAASRSFSVLSVPCVRVVTVKVYSEHVAELMAQALARRHHATVKTVRLVKPLRRQMLGLVRVPASYAIELQQPAAVLAVYHRKPAVRGEVGPLPIPPITPDVLSITLADASSLGPAGPGGAAFLRAVAHWRKQQCDEAERSFREALEQGLDPCREGFPGALWA